MICRLQLKVEIAILQMFPTKDVRLFAACILDDLFWQDLRKTRYLLAYSSWILDAFVDTSRILYEPLVFPRVKLLLSCCREICIHGK